MSMIPEALLLTVNSEVRMDTNLFYDVKTLPLYITMVIIPCLYIPFRKKSEFAR